MADPVTPLDPGTPVDYSGGGVKRPAVVVRVDKSISPPSYIIKFTDGQGGERETEHSRLTQTGVPEFPIGTQVVAHGLNGAKELNGQFGVVSGPAGKDGRIEIDFPGFGKKSLKTANVRQTGGKGPLPARAPEKPAERKTRQWAGELLRWNPVKSFGFIRRQSEKGEKDDLFVHLSSISEESRKNVKAGATIIFDIIPCPNDARHKDGMAGNCICLAPGTATTGLVENQRLGRASVSEEITNTKYCPHFMKGETCPDPNCKMSHVLATKEEMKTAHELGMYTSKMDDEDVDELRTKWCQAKIARNYKLADDYRAKLAVCGVVPEDRWWKDIKVGKIPSFKMGKKDGVVLPAALAPEAPAFVQLPEVPSSVTSFQIGPSSKDAEEEAKEKDAMARRDEHLRKVQERRQAQQQRRGPPPGRRDDRRRSRSADRRRERSRSGRRDRSRDRSGDRGRDRRGRRERSRDSRGRRDRSRDRSRDRRR